MGVAALFQAIRHAGFSGLNAGNTQQPRGRESGARKPEYPIPMISAGIEPSH